MVTLAAALASPLPARVQAAVQAYRAAIAALEAHAKTQRVEPAYEALLQLREILMRVGENQRTVLESLSDETYQQLERDLPGVLLARGEVAFVAPDPDYFVQLAVGHGDAVDRQFFAALKATYPESVWPVYVEQQTDYSGCVRFGSGTLAEAHRLWSRFRMRFPNRYVGAVRDEIDKATRSITDATCACEDAASVQRELQQVLETSAGPELRERVLGRLRALRAGRSDMRFRCVSG